MSVGFRSGHRSDRHAGEKDRLRESTKIQSVLNSLYSQLQFNLWQLDPCSRYNKHIETEHSARNYFVDA